jgi:hypothetical protein
VRGDNPVEVWQQGTSVRQENGTRPRMKTSCRQVPGAVQSAVGIGEFARAIANCRNCTNTVFFFGRASPRLRLDSCHDLMKVTALARNFLPMRQTAAAVPPNHRFESLDSPLSAELKIVMTDSGTLWEHLDSASSLRVRSALFIPAPRTLPRSTVKPLLQRARSSAEFHPSPSPAL